MPSFWRLESVLTNENISLGVGLYERLADAKQEGRLATVDEAGSSSLGDQTPVSNAANRRPSPIRQSIYGVLDRSE